MNGPTREHGSQEPKNPAEAKPTDPLLRIVRSHDPKKRDDDLDLELDEFEGDRRYGREDIADK